MYNLGTAHWKSLIDVLCARSRARAVAARARLADAQRSPEEGMPLFAHMLVTLCAAATTQHYEYTSHNVRHHSQPGLVEPSLFRALRHQQRAQKVLAAAIESVKTESVVYVED